MVTGADLKNRLFTYDEAMSSPPGEPLSVLTKWITEYPMNAHPELGRTGAVCPFVKKASKFDTLRVAISDVGPSDEEAVFAEIRSSFADLMKIPAPSGKKQLRTIAVGFPNCTDADGIAMLDRVYHRHKYYTLFHNRMIAFFHRDCDIRGLWNKEFLPMRGPMPMLGVRYMVEQDAAFAAKHKLLLAPYLLRFGIPGAKRIVAHRQNKAVSDATIDG